ncbi:hypothetical protein SKAU_G00393760 [Synaphobranchus kaupii]|uniref:Uncharacterized protein n=1 Tax=Synaphobranchus kaupii TaxID=118154 RepID=A0A9Q1EC02_SYNKA|nr:hypothetical protein SKAU_G00393760 [Synaphobranchus kaupii]
MTRVAFAKLLVVMLMAFIICLPEFFTSDQALSADFSCLPIRLCMENTGQRPDKSQTQQARDVGRGPCVNISTYEGTANRTPSSIEWFLCETEMDLRSLQCNASRSEVIELSLAIRNTRRFPRVVTSTGPVIHRLFAASEVAQQLFLYCGNCTARENTTAAATRPSRSCCILRALGTNSTEFNTSIPWTRALEESWCSGKRGLWLALVLIVIALVVGSVLNEVYWKSKRCIKKAVLLPVGASQPPEFLVRYLNEGTLPVGMTPSDVKDEVFFNTHRSKRPTLSQIHEYEEKEFTELLSNQK